MRTEFWRSDTPRGIVLTPQESLGIHLLLPPKIDAGEYGILFVAIRMFVAVQATDNVVHR